MLKFERNDIQMEDFIRFIRAPFFSRRNFYQTSCISSSLWTRRISFDINVRSTPINNEIAITWIIPPTDTFLVDHTEEKKTENRNILHRKHPIYVYMYI